MTAEVAVLNTSAVALAADSAATIDVDRAKVLRTANKLFMLSKFEPIGAMIYGSADVSGMPWETVIKAFRADLGDEALPVLTDYADRFFGWLEQHQRLFPTELREQSFLLAMGRWVRRLRETVDRVVDYFEQDPADGVDEVTPAQVAEELVGEAMDRLTAAPDSAGVPDGSPAAFNKRYRPAVDKIMEDLLTPELLTAKVRRRLRTLPGLLATHADAASSYSGLVIAGFGRDEFLPSLLEYHVFGVQEPFVRRVERRNLRVQAPRGAAIVPFAQSEMVHTFLDGIGPGLRYVLDERLDQVQQQLPEVMEEVLGAPLDAAARTRAETVAQRLRDTLDEHVERATGEHSGPIVNTVSVLPKDELAAMAESLVNLTRFKRRVSLNEVETVAGDIDVAVISKGDGFVWIRRKHYFDADRNPHWRANYWTSGRSGEVAGDPDEDAGSRA